MATCTIKLDVGSMTRAMQSRREAVFKVLQTQLAKIAEDAIDQRYGNDSEATAAYESGSVQHRLKRLNSIFIPVSLQHKRRERWPDIAPIYDAMVRRHQGSYMGNYRFWVDASKLDDFRRRILERLLRNGLARGTWKISLKTDRDHYVKVSVQKVGNVTPVDQKAAAQLAQIMQQMFAERSSVILYQILNAR